LIQVVRDVDGFQAWHKLIRKYSPITPARSLMCMIEVVTPPKVKQLAQLPAAIERWELKVYQLEREHGEKMSGKMKTAVLTSMCPQDIQDVVFQNMETGTEYATIRDKVRNLVSNRIMSASMPTPMDIGEMEAEEGWDGYGGWWPAEGEGMETELGAIGQYCYFCGKSGHYARECPAKGSEKGHGPREGLRVNPRANARSSTARVTVTARAMANSTARASARTPGRAKERASRASAGIAEHKGIELQTARTSTTPEWSRPRCSKRASEASGRSAA
jgi:hypothetical protein